MVSAREPWTTQAEAAIRALRDVDGASIQTEGDSIREIHVLTTSERPAKQIVRDVQTLLLTRFNRSIDHRVVSVAFAQPGASLTEAPSEREVEHVERIRFVGANLYVSGPRVQAQVELTWRGVSRMGSASGWGTREGANRLIAAATLAAVREYLDEDLALGLLGVEIVKMGDAQAVVVAIELHASRERRMLIGSCALDQDPPQAVALATLAALNRVVTGLPPRLPNENLSRPASTRGGK